MVKVILTFKKDNLTLKNKEYNLQINQKVIQDEIVKLTTLSIDNFQIFYVDNQNDQISLIAQDDYDIAKEQFGNQTVTFIVRPITNEPIAFIQQQVKTIEVDSKDIKQDIKQQKPNKKQKQGKDKQQKKQKSKSKELLIKQKSKQIIKNQMKQSNGSPIIQDINEIKIIIKEDQQQKKLKQKQQKKQNKIKKEKIAQQKKKEKQIKLLKAAKLKQIAEANDLSIKEQQLQKKLELLMRKLLKQQCFIDKEVQNQTSIKSKQINYLSLNKFTQKICSVCNSKIQTVPFYMNNHNQIYCDICQSKSDSTQTLVKIKNKQYINNLIMSKHVSVFKQDLNQEQLNEISKNQSKARFLKIIKKNANNQFVNMLNKQIQHFTLQQNNEKLQKKQAQKLLRKEQEAINREQQRKKKQQERLRKQQQKLRKKKQKQLQNLKPQNEKVDMLQNIQQEQSKK